MKLCNSRTLHAIAAVLCLGLREASAASPASSLRSAEEKDGVERSLRLKPVEKEVGDDASKDVDVPVRDFEYSEEFYEKQSLQRLCPKSLSCRRKGDLAVMIDRKCTCLRPCSQVCRNFSIRCGGSYGPGSPWETYENLRCYQWERGQGRPVVTWPPSLPISRRWLRTTCRCPNRDYSVSNACQPWTQANLSNCIKGEIFNGGAYEINFGDLTNVQLGHVHASGFEIDIDFQGDVSGSHMCKLESDSGDIEFGGEECPINFVGNTVFDVDVGKDFKFEEGAWVTNNIFMAVNAGDDWQFNGSPAAIRPTLISNNYISTTYVADKCNYNAHAVADANIYGNTCNSFFVDEDDDCDDVYDGFSCV